MNPLLKPPRPPHGQRLLISCLDEIAAQDPDRVWLVMPRDDSDLKVGFKEITYKQFVSGANVAARWLRENLGLQDEKVPVFAYAGPRDLRYPFFAIAAGKLGYQMMLPSSSLSATSQKHIMDKKNCLVFLHGQSDATDSIAQELRLIDERVKTIMAPSVEELMKDDRGEVIAYQKTWEQEKDRPWLVFHTSGTTGFPKTVTYTQSMMVFFDTAAGLDDIEDTPMRCFWDSRVYVPVPIMHYVGMIMALSSSTFTNTVNVFGPATRPPSPAVLRDILTFTQVDGAMLTPAMIDGLCQNAETLELLRKLKHILYTGAPLNANSGRLLSPYVRLGSAVGSTDSGGYLTSMPNRTEDWDYLTFHRHMGIVMEHRFDDMHELVFVRDPQCVLQKVFEAFPDLDRYETRDLWVEHPTKKGQWKIVGRTDDLIKLSSGLGVFVTPLETIIVEHALVRNVLVGGQGWSKTILLIEPIESAMEQVTTPEGRADFISSLDPLIEKANARCYEPARLDKRLVVFATAEKPWPRTIKDTVLRSQTLKLYEHEIADAYESVGL